MTFYRLASTCASCHGPKLMAESFCPRPLGVGMPGGCKAPVHAARRFLVVMPSDHVMVKLDFSNAFDSLHRRPMLEAVSASLPGIYGYCR